MTDNRNSQELFRQALIEARLRKSQKIIDAYPEEVNFSEKHLRKMQEILRYSQHKSWLKHPKLGRKRMLAVLIAAIMMLVGSIAVYANRDAIIRFMEQIFDRHTEVSYQADTANADVPQWIEDEYTLTYVPEGYKVSEYESDPINVWIQWNNLNGDYIRFTQLLIEQYCVQYDNEHSSSQEIKISNATVYFMVHSSARSAYLWTDGQYGYELSCPTNLPLEEVIQMIEGVAKKDQ